MFLVGWAMTEIVELLSFLGGFVFALGSRDCHIWTPNPSKRFSYNSFLYFKQSLGCPSFLTLWEIEIPKKIKFFG